MSTEAEIQEALLRMIKVACRNHTVIEGTVVAGSVDQDNCWCDVLIDDGTSSITFQEVPLKVLTGSVASIIEYPADGSPVLMKFRDGNQDRPQIDKIQIVDTVVINPGTLTQFGEGEDGGMVLVNPLTVALNAGQNDSNTLKKLIANWTPVPDDGGASLKALLAEWCAEELPMTKTADIESTTITQ